MKSIIIYSWIFIGLLIAYFGSRKVLKNREKYGIDDMSDGFVRWGFFFIAVLFWPAIVLHIIYDEIVKLYWVIRALLLIKKHEDKEKDKI